MTHYPKQIIRLGVLTAWFVGAFITHAQDGALRDTAAFFSEPAKAEASRTIAEIGRRFRKDLVIETFREIPAAVRQGVNLQDKPAVNGLFTQWTEQQARQLKVNGIYILLTKEPAHLQIVVGNETQNNAFTLKDRDALASLMLGKLRSQKHDEALLEGVNFVSTTMASHAAARTRPTPSAASKQSESSGWLGTALAVMLGLAVIWLAVGLFRSLSGEVANQRGQEQVRSPVGEDSSVRCSAGCSARRRACGSTISSRAITVPPRGRSRTTAAATAGSQVGTATTPVRAAISAATPAAVIRVGESSSPRSTRSRTRLPSWLGLGWDNQNIPTNLIMPVWRNGRRTGLKIPTVKCRVGSSPATGTTR